MCPVWGDSTLISSNLICALRTNTGPLAATDMVLDRQGQNPADTLEFTLWRESSEELATDRLLEPKHAHILFK